jgi:hypothetical protein
MIPKYTIEYTAQFRRPEFDRVVKTAAGMLASKRICASLGIKADEEKFRFGFIA